MAKTAVSHSGSEARGPAQARGPGQGPTSPMPRAGSGRPLRLRQIWCKSVDGGLLGKWVKYNEFFLFIPFFSSTHLQVRRDDDGFSRLMAQTTRTRARMCLLGVSLTLLPILGVKSPKNPNFWGVNGRFQAYKRAKY